MIPLMPGSAESRIQYEDHSGVDMAAYANPYDALIEACENDPVPAPFSDHPVKYLCIPSYSLSEHSSNISPSSNTN